MLSVAQLDPASLTLWINPELVTKTDGDLVGECLDHASRNDLESLGGAIGKTDGGPQTARCMYLASVVWHEQRHFLDLLLTNYGADRFREFAAIYVNADGLMRSAREAGEFGLDPIPALTLT